MGDWTRRATLIYPVAAFNDARKDACANAFVLAGLETFANERLMFDKAGPMSTDYGLTQTHAAISSQVTPAVASALVTALSGISGLWYLLDAETGNLINTNDPAKTGGKGLAWSAGMGLAVNEVVEYQGALYQVIQAHTSQADWTPDIARSLFKRYRPPGEVSAWVQPQGAHDAYPVGARVTYNGDTWINTIPANVWQPGVTGWTNQTAPVTPEWTTGVLYRVNDEVTYQGVLYRCRQQHTSQAGWQPPNVLALWLPI